jgi:hypothetical protein
MDWIQFGTTFGLPMLILAAAALFVAKSVWPFVTKRIEAGDAERTIERDKFLAALERRDAVQKAESEALHALAVAFQSLREGQKQERWKP